MILRPAVHPLKQVDLTGECGPRKSKLRVGLIRLSMELLLWA
ncbi:hypothetical protein RBSH_02775 [Rhodopirellula baltica SH28]|uniref:Uncharacterized protein n=1 Tax=Rhodopirellula baltica SH28 TaxID=993517 RepID=K5DGH2_RHOBT|nr:hypothetical protein RBSH_02775 [Rhodopirellula baltica SH28]